uniref:Uncharacterized protein n=1 Tax=Romanomermis culicivorax TaxID=13658 RepID=A0A915KJR5_ROMCU
MGPKFKLMLSQYNILCHKAPKIHGGKYNANLGHELLVKSYGDAENFEFINITDRKYYCLTKE